MENQKIDWKKYIFTFIITVVVFITVIYLSNYFSQKKIEEIRGIQDKISIDILSSETQFSLLEESSCEDLGGASALSKELGTLEDKLAYTERDRGSKDAEVQILKKYYSLLEIKDYILMKKISEKCKKTPLTIVYFYSNSENCVDCEREGYVLTHLRQEYPELRIYSFDYDLDLSAIKTFISINNIENKLPAIIVKNKVYYGFQDIESINKMLPELKTIKEARNASSTTATSTKN